MKCFAYFEFNIVQYAYIRKLLKYIYVNLSFEWYSLFVLHEFPFVIYRIKIL